jgi:hypothetical protein
MRIVVWAGGGVGSQTLLEVDDDGRIHRELGLGVDGRVLYIAPALRGEYRYGVFDLQCFAAGTLPSDDEFPRADFERLWDDGARVFGARDGWTVS